MTDENTGFTLGTLAVALFSLTLPTTRFIIDHFDPVFIGLGRAVIAAIIAAGLLFFSSANWPDKRQFYQLIITAAGVVIGFPVFSAWAMQTLPAFHGGIMLALLPLATAIVGVFIAHERPSVGYWLAALGGCGLVLGFALLKGSGSFQTGDFALLAAIISAAVGYAVGGKLSREMSGWRVICWSLVIALPFILIPALLTMPDKLKSVPWSAWGGFLYLALFSQLFGFFLWNKGLALGGIAHVSQTQLLQPFFTLAFSSLLLAEKIDRISILFAVLVVTVVFIGKRMPVFQHKA